MKLFNNSTQFDNMYGICMYVLTTTRAIFQAFTDFFLSPPSLFCSSDDPLMKTPKKEGRKLLIFACWYQERISMRIKFRYCKMRNCLGSWVRTSLVGFYMVFFFLGILEWEFGGLWWWYGVEIYWCFLLMYIRRGIGYWSKVYRSVLF